VELSKWLEKCFIGRLSKAADVKSVKESFFLGGFNFVRIRYLGEKYVLLSYEEEGIIEKAIVENKVWFYGIFGSIVPWNDSFVVPKKLVRFAIEAFHCLFGAVDAFNELEL